MNKKLIIRNTNNEVLQTCIFNDVQSLDNFINLLSVQHPWGKPEYQVVDVPVQIIEHEAIPEVLYQAPKDAVLDQQGNILEPSVSEILAVPAQDAWVETVPEVLRTIPSEYTIEIIDITNEIKLQRIRERRNLLINEADILMNIAYDNTSGIAAAKAYRQALRDVTDAFVVDMSLLDAVDPETFVFPAKP